MMLGRTFLKGHVSMLGDGEGGGMEPLLSNQADHLLRLAFGEMIVKALRARLNSSSGHMWPPGLRLLTPSASDEMVAIVFGRIKF